MNTITINNEEYILSEELFIKAPVYCKDARNGRELIKKNKLKDFIFAKLEKEKWKITDGNSRKCDKTLFKLSFVNTIPEITEEKQIIDDNNIELAPDIIHLNDSEKFKDDNNNIIEIETRGERAVDKIYFKVKDVMKEFKLENFDKNIHDKKSYFKENEHYKYFNCKKINKTIKTIKIKKELFLTYEGMLRVLFASHSPNVKPFIKWATNSLFVMHLGNQHQKNELVSNLLGVNAKAIKEVFNTSTNTLPCIYLFTLGTVKNLRTSMNINSNYSDESIVAKFGFTKDLARRTSEHITNFNKIINVDLKLKHHSYIDPQYISNGESDLKLFISALKINYVYENYEELIIIPPDLIKIVEKQYEQIGKSYMGHIAELITKIKELENINEKLILIHELELSKEQQKNIIKDNEFELYKEQHKNIIKDKDLEFLQYKIKILEMQNKN